MQQDQYYSFYKSMYHQTRSPQNSEFKIRVDGIPENGAKSRVETQIKLSISLVSKDGTHIPYWSYLRIPDELLAGSKLRKSQQQKLLDGSAAAMVSDESKVLDLEARVICESDESKVIKMCQGCVRRERKRAERKKDAKSSLYELNGSILDEAFERDRKRVLLFNCDPLVSFSSGEAILPTRITCYCRHHNERIGFRVRFTMRNDQGAIVAMGESPPIMITDDHKSSKQQRPTTTTTTRKRRRVSVDDYTPTSSRTNSICDSESSEPFALQTTPFLLDQDIFSPQESLSPKTPTSLESFGQILDDKLTLTHLAQPFILQEEQDFFTPPPTRRRRLDDIPETCSPSSLSLIPILDQIMPASGSSMGGLQVTLTGQHFHRGLTVMFGNRVATMLSCTPQSMVCLLPVAEHPGSVVISFKEHSLMRASPMPPVFHYIDTSRHDALTLAPLSTQSDLAGHNLLHFAAYNNDAHLAALLVSRLPSLLHAQDANGLTPLYFACLMKSTLVVDILVKAGASMDLVGTPLHYDEYNMFQKPAFDPFAFQHNDSLLYHM